MQIVEVVDVELISELDMLTIGLDGHPHVGHAEFLTLFGYALFQGTGRRLEGNHTPELHLAAITGRQGTHLHVASPGEFIQIVLEQPSLVVAYNLAYRDASVIGFIDILVSHNVISSYRIALPLPVSGPIHRTARLKGKRSHGAW